MKLFEYQGQKLFEQFGIPVPGGRVVTTADQVLDAVQETGLPAVVKAQVLIGGRGKAGGVKLVKSENEAQAAVSEILGMTIKELPVEAVYIVPAVSIEHEYYFGIIVNRNKKLLECMVSAAGGMDIEEVAAMTPEKIITFEINPVFGLDHTKIQQLLSPLFDSSETTLSVVSIIESMYRLFRDRECSLVEINPLVVTGEGSLLAIDAKVVIDDNGIAKHPDLEDLRNDEEYSLDEIDARNAGLSFVSLDGTIGCMVNGAGLSMATMDLIKLSGEEPANFLDIGGSSNPDKVVTGLTILMRNPSLKAILLNIFGGITRCDDIANGLVQAKSKIDITVPMVIRLVGTNDAEGRKILSDAGITSYEDLTEAVENVVAMVRKG
jgi:succinyl-CoA synthetase beta subunit